MQDSTQNELRDAILTYVKSAVRSAVTSAESHHRSNMVTSSDVQAGLRVISLQNDRRMQPQTVYGFGPPGVWSTTCHLVLKQIYPELHFSASALAVINDYATDMLRRVFLCACQQSASHHGPSSESMAWAMMRWNPSLSTSYKVAVCP